MTLVFQGNPDPGTPGAAQPAYSGIAPDVRLATVYNGQARHPYYPWRYFIAGGRTLAKIQDVMDNARDCEAALAAYGQSHGAARMHYTAFHFPGAAVVEEPECIRYRLNRHEMMIGDQASRDIYAPDAHSYEGYQLRVALAAIRLLPEDQRKQECEKLARSVGALACDGTHFRYGPEETRTAFIAPAVRRLQSNPDFIASESMGDDWFQPDPATDEGLRLAGEVDEISYRRYPDHVFAKWLGADNVDTNPNGHPRFSIDTGRPNEKQMAQIEKIGEQWIVKVPVIGTGRYGADGKGGILSGYQESWALPPDSEPLTIAAYYQMLEDAGALSRTPGSRDVTSPVPPAP